MQAGGWGKPGSMTAHQEGSFGHLGCAMWSQEFFQTGEGGGEITSKRMSNSLGRVNQQEGGRTEVGKGLPQNMFSN